MHVASDWVGRYIPSDLKE